MNAISTILLPIATIASVGIVIFIIKSIAKKK